jgi:hypothetical protein
MSDLKICNQFVGFEVFTVVVMKSIIFWDITPCSWEVEDIISARTSK